MSTNFSKTECGVGLIEVLITLLILSTTLIALAALQTRSLQFNQGAYFRTQANMLAYDMLDRIRINDSLPASVREPLASYSMTETAHNPSSSIVSSPLSGADKYQWLKNIADRLPGGKGTITCVNTSRLCTVEITWTDLNSSGLTNADEDKTAFSYQAKL